MRQVAIGMGAEVANGPVLEGEVERNKETKLHCKEGEENTVKKKVLKGRTGKCVWP